jgi:hypothetical protein
MHGAWNHDTRNRLDSGILLSARPGRWEPLNSIGPDLHRNFPTDPGFNFDYFSVADLLVNTLPPGKPFS